MSRQQIYTFWEGKMPAYLSLCLETWKFPFVILTYDNLHQYTDARVTGKVKERTLPKVGDWVRIHVLRDAGGYWLDTDTIMINDTLPHEALIGNNELRGITVGFLHATQPHDELFDRWAEYQDMTLDNLPNMSTDTTRWSILGNDFSDPYLKSHTDIKIADIDACWPENYMIADNITRPQKYNKFYFESNYTLEDIKKTNMLMLHNSWTPEWYKNLSRDAVLHKSCTLSNILKEIIL